MSYIAGGGCDARTEGGAMGRLWMLVASSGLLAACDDDPLPNPARLSVSGTDGVPVLTWAGPEQETLAIVDWRSGSGETLWEIAPVGGPPVCVNGMFSGVTYGEAPAGFELRGSAVSDPPPATLRPGEDYEAMVSRCDRKTESGGASTSSYVRFRVLGGGRIQMDCDLSMCP
jgi:hypothetical protein